MDIEQFPEYLLDHAEEMSGMPFRDETGKPNLFATGIGGDTLLHVAVGLQDFHAVRLLVHKGLDVNVRGDYFQTPFMVAAMGATERDAKMRELPLELGADPSIPDSFGLLPSHFMERNGVKPPPDAGSTRPASES